MMRANRFRYVAPRSLDEATRALRDSGPSAMLLAGGTDLVPNMKRRQQTPPVVISLRRLRELRETVRKMLKENGPPPTGKWADIAVLEPVRDYKARHASTLLTFDAVVSALDQIDAKPRAQAAE